MIILQLWFFIVALPQANMGKRRSGVANREFGDVAAEVSML